MLQKSSLQKVLAVFFKNSTKEFSLIDISREIQLAHTSVKSKLQELLKEGIIQKRTEKRGKRKFPLFRANRDNANFQMYKQLYNQRVLAESGVMNFLEEKLLPNTIVLFGSYQRGEDDEQSDIDLYIEAKEKEVNVKNFEKKLQRKIQLHFKDPFTSYPKELKNNILNGTVLQGFLEGYK